MELVGMEANRPDDCILVVVFDEYLKVVLGICLRESDYGAWDRCDLY